MRQQPIFLLPSLLLLATTAHAATKYVTTTCTSTSTTTITHISASSTQIFTSAIPIPNSPITSAAPSTTILVPLSSASAPSAGSSLVYSSEVAPFPSPAVAGTGALVPAGTGAAGKATGTGAPITPAVPYKGAAAGSRNPGSVLVLAAGAVAAVAAWW